MSAVPVAMASQPQPAPATELGRVCEGRAYLSQAKVAHALDVSPRTVRSWEKTRKLGFPLPVRMPITGVYYPVSELLAFEARFLALPRSMEARIEFSARHVQLRKLPGARARDERRQMDAIERDLIASRRGAAVPA